MFLSIPALITLVLVVAVIVAWFGLFCYDRGWHDGYGTLENLIKEMRK